MGRVWERLQGRLRPSKPLRPRFLHPPHPTLNPTPRKPDQPPLYTSQKPPNLQPPPQRSSPSATSTATPLGRTASTPARACPSCGAGRRPRWRRGSSSRSRRLAARVGARFPRPSLCLHGCTFGGTGGRALSASLALLARLHVWRHGRAGSALCSLALFARLHVWRHGWAGGRSPLSCFGRRFRVLESLDTFPLCEGRVRQVGMARVHVQAKWGNYKPPNSTSPNPQPTPNSTSPSPQPTPNSTKTPQARATSTRTWSAATT